MKRSSGLHYFAVAAIALLSMGRVDAAVTVECDLGGLQYFVTRGFYVDDYAGSSIDTVTILHKANVAGERTIAMTARLSTYDGTLIRVVQVSRMIETTYTKTVFDFGGVRISPGARITFSQAVIAGNPANVLYDGGIGPCTNVTMTADTAPPLSVFHEDSAGVIITGDAESVSSALNFLCPYSDDGAGDPYTRGFYIVNYRGSTIDTVRLRHKASVAGNRTIALVARLNSYDGPLVGVANVSRNITTAWTESVFDFGNAVVPAGSVVTFQQVLNAGSVPLLYDSGYGPCEYVAQTTGTAPPLDTLVRDSVGVQIRGRVASGIGVLAVEYRHTVFDHYFLTADPAEIAGLDGGAYGGVFVRTGQTFYVRDGPVAETADVCRFFTVTFAPKSSHFYTENPAECGFVKLNPDWFYEKIAFFVTLPAAGVCSFGRPPVYRMYNNGMTGAPNHRFVTSLAIYNDFTTNRGWTGEGVHFCSDDPLI